MHKCYLLILLLLAILMSACKSSLPLSTALQEKMEPYDQFSLQRSFPDRDFDWRGWRNAIQEARLETAVAERSSGCGSTNEVAWTQQGPANVAGRLNTLAIHPTNENIILAGFSGGGIFKTTDAGVTWHPVFDQNTELAIGDIEFDPINPDVVYAGTGDVNIPSIVYNGNGIYKSTDGGESWQYLGLGQEGIISKIAIDPTNTNILYAATMGTPYVRDNHRGIYKSIDGGLSWQQQLFISDQAGASDLLLNPQNPQILYASFWDRIRNNQESIIYGPHAKVYKSSDGGANWSQLGGGLPTGIMGRTGLAMSAQNPDKIFVVYVDTLSRPGGLYQSINGGQGWTPINISGLQDAYADFGWYFGKFRVNTYNDDDWYFLGILTWRKAPGTNSWLIGAGAHADCHDMVFAPSGKRYLATDGGMYANTMPNITWTKSKNLPTTAFYHVNYNPHTPDVYWGGAQDNGVQKGNGTGINNWVSVFSADGFHVAFDPNNAEQFWVEIQNGAVHRTQDNGDSWAFGTTAFGTGDRCSWDAPFFISKFGVHPLYAATYRAYASSNGQSWGNISPDLTDGNIFGDRFHTVTAMSESPLLEGKLFAGTSDGNVWRREPNGNWSNLTSGLPNRWVTAVVGSPVNVNRIYTTHSGFRDNEDIPHVHRSDNNGQNWTDISSNLPQVPVNDILVLPGYADSILLVGTDAGTYFSLNRGDAWTRLGNNMPFVPVFDLELNIARNEIMAATFGRGIWTMPVDSLFSLQSGTNTTVSVSGNIQTENGLGVSNVSVNANPPGSNGQFLLPAVPGCDTITLTPYRNDNPLNGVTTFDLVLISKHILAIDTLDSPYKLIAADANHSNTITTFDIVSLRRLILGIDTVFSSNTSWRFVPTDFVFAHPEFPFMDNFPESLLINTSADPYTGANFTGIKIGDLNGTVNPFTSTELEDRSDLETWPLYYQLQRAGNGWMADFYAGSAELAGLQFTLAFDPAALKNIRLETNADCSAEHFNLNLLEQGKLPFCMEWLNSTHRVQLFRLYFEIPDQGNPEEIFQLQNTPTPALCYDAFGKAYKPQLTPVRTGTTDGNWFPNPFSNQGIWLSLPGSEPFDIQIFNASGVLIHQRRVTANDSESLQYFPTDLFPENGVYLYRIIRKTGVQSGTFILARP
ncbi:MAG: T9SS type A sorting domain-containing protein [Lewinellaceae bacterium]|nr:T9SS type A sorting domain-containing protein [Lewinellaceae bacterium]